jgi:hypothetical protein
MYPTGACHLNIRIYRDITTGEMWFEVDNER